MTLGKTLLIVNPAGDILKRRMISANDLAFSPADSCFWILGNLLRRLDHDANVSPWTALEERGCVVAQPANA